MTNYQLGDITCSAVQRPDGRFQGRLIVVESLFGARPPFDHTCPEIDNAKAEATRRAMDYANQHFPPE